MGKTKLQWVVSMSVSWLLYYSFEKCYYWGKLSKAHMRSPSIISHNCMIVYNYLNKTFNNNNKRHLFLTEILCLDSSKNIPAPSRTENALCPTFLKLAILVAFLRRVAAGGEGRGTAACHPFHPPFILTHPCPGSYYWSMLNSVSFSKKMKVKQLNSLLTWNVPIFIIFYIFMEGEN